MEPGLPAHPQVEGKLAVREEDEAFLVVREEVPGDWLARFDQGDGFPARAWAEKLVRVYNRRLGRRSAAPPTPRHSASQLLTGLGAAMTTRML